ncbi:MAG TPA: PEP-CTERM sorting domain-containing protein [Candidatus Paceibacterota bacterium]|nr:PEP-CTERM sorting domain-containing protein [Candidatus Paceibacterota bacterium]
MKAHLFGAVAITIGVLPLAAQFTSHWSGSPLVVPDNSLVGVSDTRWVNDPALAGFEIRSVQVHFLFSGGYNGDLYAQLNHNGQFSVLLNRAGVSPADELGYSDSGFSLTLADSAENGDVHMYQATLAASGLSLGGAALTGTWAADGRPYGQATATDPLARTATLSRFNGMGINGNWTLFLADLSPGGQGQLLSWGLEISYVPESAGLALCFGLGLLGWGISRRTRAPGRR